MEGTQMATKKNAKKFLKKTAPIVDVKLAQANNKSTESVETDKPEVAATLATPEIKALAKNATPVQRGIHFNKLAGVKDKHQVIAVFGKNGYAAYSWDKRAEILECTTEELCRMFREDPKEVAMVWKDRMESRLIVKDAAKQTTEPSK
jgi:hypothetical protein